MLTDFNFWLELFGLQNYYKLMLTDFNFWRWLLLGRDDDECRRDELRQAKGDLHDNTKN